MRKLIFILPLLFFISCSSSSKVNKDINQKINNENFSIDYYTIGGITGRSQGITLNSDGKLDYWSGATFSNRTITDSSKVNEEILNRFSQLLQDSTIFNFNYQEKGNLTTVLRISVENKNNNITYSGTIIPTNFPQQIKVLIKELNNLVNK